MASPAVRAGSSPAAAKERESSPVKGAAAESGAQDPSAVATTAATTPAKTQVARAKVPLRKGKWTPEEEMYANRIILYFNQGVLNIPAGTTLRSFLSERLNCDPMRITKKFAGASCIGKQVFSPCEQSAANLEEITRCEEELRQLEKVFLERLEQKNAVAFDLREQTPTKDAEVKGSEQSKHGHQSAPRSSGRSKNSGSSSGEKGVGQGATAAFKKAISAPDLTQLAQLHAERKHMVPLGEEDPYTVDDKAAGDLLLEFFRKLHEDHAASVRAAKEADAVGQGTDAPGTPHTQARKQRKVGFDEEATRKESTLHPQSREFADDYESRESAENDPSRSRHTSSDAVRMNGVTSKDRESIQRMYPTMYGAHALKRRRSSEPALDRLVPLEPPHQQWLAKLHSSSHQPLDDDAHCFHPQKHLS